MNENYLNHLLSNGYFTASGSTMNYHLWTTMAFYNQADFVIPVKKDISFIKKEIPKFEFRLASITIDLENISEEDINSLKERLISSLKVPSWLLDSSYGLISDPTEYEYFDEFH